VNQADWEARMNHVISTLVSAGVIAATQSSRVRHAVTLYYRRALIGRDYHPTSALRSASTRVTLVRASDSVVDVAVVGEDYGLSDLYDGRVDVHVMQGTHESIVTDADKSTQLARLLDAVLSPTQITAQ